MEETDVCEIECVPCLRSAWSYSDTSAYVGGIDYLSATAYGTLAWRDISSPVHPCSLEAANSSSMNPKVTTTNTASTGWTYSSCFTDHQRRSPGAKRRDVAQKRWKGDWGGNKMSERGKTKEKNRSKDSRARVATKRLMRITKLMKSNHFLHLGTLNLWWSSQPDSYGL